MISSVVFARRQLQDTTMRCVSLVEPASAIVKLPSENHFRANPDIRPGRCLFFAHSWMPIEPLPDAVSMFAMGHVALQLLSMSATPQHPSYPSRRSRCSGCSPHAPKVEQSEDFPGSSEPSQ